MACVPALAPFDADFGAAPPALFVHYARLYLRLVRLLSHAAAAVDEPVVIVALSMACLAAVRADGKMRYDLSKWFGPDETTSQDLLRQEQLRFNAHIMNGGR